jgi:hypothetical protein
MTIASRGNLETVRWGDRRTFPWTTGQLITTGDIFRVEAPFPTVWRVILTINCDVLNDPVNFTFVVAIGVGAVVQDYGFVIPPHVITSFELPGQVLAGRFTTGAGLVANSQVLFDALIAPIVPWDGLKVEVAPSGGTTQSSRGLPVTRR